MSTVKPRELTRAKGRVAADVNISNAQHPDDTASRASALVLQISLASIKEIDCLISDLNDLRTKIENRCSRMQDDIIEFAELSRSTAQVTKIVSDSVARVQTKPVSNSSSNRDQTANLEVASIAATQ